MLGVARHMPDSSRRLLTSTVAFVLITAAVVGLIASPSIGQKPPGALVHATVATSPPTADAADPATKPQTSKPPTEPAEDTAAPATAPQTTAPPTEPAEDAAAPATKPQTTKPPTTAPPNEAAAPAHPRCDPSLRNCAVKRPAAFDAFRQSPMAPEMTLLAKRRVSRLFVVPPPARSADAASAKAASSVVLFAMWLLTAVDPQGAVVLTAKTATRFNALGDALADVQHQYDPSVWGNVFVAPVSFAAFDDDAQEPPVVLWHLSGLDAAEERYEPDTIVLLSAPPRMRLNSKADPAVAMCDPDTFHTKTKKVLTRVTATSSNVSGARVFELLRQSAWRFWFVKMGDEQAETWRLDSEANTGGDGATRIDTIAELLSARGVAEHVFAPTARLLPAGDVPPSCPPRRQMEGVVVSIVPGKIMCPESLHLNLHTFLDNALNLLTRNPQWGLVLVTAFNSHEIIEFAQKLAPFYRANIRVRSEWADRLLCREMQENQAIDLNHREESAACLGALTAAARQCFPFLAPPATLMLMPLIDSQVFAGNLTAALSGDLNQKTTAHPSPAFPVVVTVPASSADPVPAKDDVVSAMVIGRSIVSNLTSAPGEHNQSLVAELSVFGSISPTARRHPQWAERPGSLWSATDAHAVLDIAEAMGAVVVWQTNIHRSPQASPWRYHIQRRRVDPASVRALDPYDKAKLWCDMATLEGCAPSLVAAARQSHLCEEGLKVDESRLRIKCDARRDGRVSADHVRPRPVLRQPMPSVLDKLQRNATSSSREDYESERDAISSRGKVGGSGSVVAAARVPVDVLVSLISREDGVDPIEQAESWLEYCPTCVLVYEIGAGDPGALYDLLKRHLAHDVFDRLIVNPKLGMGDPAQPPLLERHVHNIEYARCFVAPLRVMMVADNQAPFRAGIAEYMLAHSSYDVRDVYALPAESYERHPGWIDPWTQSTSPKLLQAAQAFVYGPDTGVQWWHPPVHYYCTGKAFFRQTRSGISSGHGFEGIWFTGMEWSTFTLTYQVQYRVHGRGFREHVLPQVHLFEDQLRHLYGAPVRRRRGIVPAGAARSYASRFARPLGRNTCLLARLLQKGFISLDDLKAALRDKAEGFQFTVKRVGTSCADAGRKYLRLERKRELGLRFTNCSYARH